MDVLLFQYGKNGDEFPFSLPLFPSVGWRSRAEVGLVPLRTMPSFTNLDELAEVESPSGEKGGP